jgi:hypothetical protein
MITIGEGLRAYLLADTAIAALVGTRIYPLRLPQKAEFPSIVYQRISGIRFGHLRGQGSLARPRYQVDCWDRQHLAVTRLGNLCRARLAGFQGQWSDDESPETIITVQAILFEDERDLFEEEINGGICRHSADYFLYHSTAANTV